MKTYTIIAGINGSGKSSFTGSLKFQLDDLGIIVDADKITAEEYGGDEYEGGKAAIAIVEKALKDGVSFTQETTLSGGYTKKVVIAARDAGYRVRMIYIGIDTLEESRKRISNRVEKGGHNIPVSDTQRRFDKRVPSLMKILPYCNDAVFFDNANGFAEVAQYKNGELTLRGTYCPKWLTEIVEIGFQTSHHSHQNYNLDEDEDLEL